MQDYMRKWNLGGLASNNNGGILAPVQVFVTLFSATGSLKKGPFFGKVYFGCIFWLFFSDRSSQLLAFVWLLRKCSKQELTLKTWDENTWISIFTRGNLLSNTILISVREGVKCCTLSKSRHCQKGEGVPPMPRFVVKRFESYLCGFVVKGFLIFF